MITAIAIDDEPLALALIQAYADKVEGLAQNLHAHERGVCVPAGIPR
jgi:hypothetical protein